MTTKDKWERYGIAGPVFKTRNLDAPLGWRCPVCGKGLAPHVSECSCVEDNAITYTGNVGKLTENDWDFLYKLVTGLAPPEA